METFMFNLNGFEHNQSIKHPPTALMSKKLKDFYFKNVQFKAFLNGVDKRDEKSIINSFKATELETADRVIKKNTWDRSLLIVAEGSIIAFDINGEN